MVWTDDAKGLSGTIRAVGNPVIGAADEPVGSLYVTNLVATNIAGDTTLAFNNYLSAVDSAGTGVVDLLKGDSSDHTVLNAKTGKTIKLAVAGTTVGTVDSNSIDFPKFNLTDGSDKNYTLAGYAAGTAYSLTATSAALDFGTTDTDVTLNKAGTYLLFARVNLEYAGATFAANRTVTLKIRRTNNTPADITNATTAVGTNVTTTVTGIMGVVTIPAVLYTTTVTTDIIAIYGDVSVIPTAGNLNATEANIVAVRLY